MKRLYPLLFISVLIYWGCEGTTKCKDCTKLFDTQFSITELDSIVQDLENYHSTGSVYYENWDEFMNHNFDNPELGINQTDEVCTKSGFMVSVDPISSREEKEDIWYSNGFNDSDSLFDGSDTTIFILGTMYYECQ